MRILMLVQSTEVRGPVPRHSAYLVEGLRRLGCDVTTALWGRHSDDETFFAKVAGRLKDALRVRKQLQNDRFDMMVVKTAHDWATLSRDVPLVLMTRRLCPRIVIQFHGSDPARLESGGGWLFRRLTKMLLSRSDAAMVLSTQESAEWAPFSAGKPFYVVENPYVPNGLHAPARTAHSGGGAVVLFVGRLIEGKGILELLDAFSRLDDREARLVVVGDGAARPAVEARVRQLGLRDRCTLAGYLSGAELAEAYSSADIFVLPTKLSEGFPTVLAEAMDAGLPIITTNLRGAADHLRDGVNCIFVRPGDAADLSKALARLVEDPALRAAMGAANRDEVAKFSPEAVSTRYFEVLQEVARA